WGGGLEGATRNGWDGDHAKAVAARGRLRISRRGFLCRPASGVCLRQGRYYRRAAAVAGYQLRARQELTKRRTLSTVSGRGDSMRKISRSSQSTGTPIACAIS